MGAYLGALLVNFYTLDLQVLTFWDDYFVRSFVHELLGSFFFVIFVLIQIDEKLSMTKHATLHCFGIACSYVAARAIFYGQVYSDEEGNQLGVGSYGAVLNPAIALGIQLSTLFNEGFGAWKAIYVYPLVPLLGSLLGTFFYEYVYAKVQEFLNPH